MSVSTTAAPADAKSLPVTIFAIPKAFRGHFGVIQRNAIASWTRLRPKVDVILFGSDPGTAEFAAELGLRHIPDVLSTESGAPRFDDLFAKAEQAVPRGLLCYVNADIMLMDDFARAAERVASLSPLMMIGRRWNTDIAQPWDFQAPDWQARLRDFVLRHGSEAPTVCIDYFLFTKGLGLKLPPMALGRLYWDSWLIWHARRKGAAVVDASAVVMAVHQNHDYSHHPAGMAGVWQGAEPETNRRLAGGAHRKLTTEDASHRLTPEGMARSYRHHWLKFRRVWRRPRTLVEIVRTAISDPSKV